MKAKKIVSFIAAMAIAATMAVPATLSFAAEPTATTTVNITHATGVDNYDVSNYSAYKIFAGDLSSDGTTLSNVTWAVSDAAAANIISQLDTDIFTDTSSAAAIAKTLGTGDNVITDSAAAKNFAAAVTYAINVEGSDITTTIKGDNATKTITLPDHGYYIIVGSKPASTDEKAAVSRSILVFADGLSGHDVTLKESVPSVEKKVKDDEGNTWQDITDQEIGKTVSFKLTGTLPSTYDDYSEYAYTFHDTLSKGLTFDPDSVVVTVNGIEVTTGFTVTPDTVTSDPTADTAITVAFKDLKDKELGAPYTNLTKDSKIVVTYNAKVNSGAEIGNNGNPNEVYLEYSNNPNGDGTGKTAKDVVTVVTFKLDVTKVDATDTTQKLSGAEFTLQNAAGEYYDSATKTWVAQEKKLTTDNNGAILAEGLKEGTYTLTETKAPNGHDLLASPIDFKIVATYNTNDNNTVSGEWDGAATDALAPIKTLKLYKGNDAFPTEGATAIDITEYTTEDGTENANVANGNVDLQIANVAGKGLPSTGGMGRTILYVCGGIVVLGAGVLLIT
ncbi:MAG: isopeptide-forming domain-containing fimbrial protein, partial [Oscillospiraceae bacterium]